MICEILRIVAGNCGTCQVNNESHHNFDMPPQEQGDRFLQLPKSNSGSQPPSIHHLFINHSSTIQQPIHQLVINCIS